MKIALAQLNTVVGDIDGNAARIVDHIDRAKLEGVDLIVFPELTVFGYPPKDLLNRPALIQRNLDALDRIAAACTGLTAIVGYVQPDPSTAGTGRFNSAAVCMGGRVAARYAKMLLPTYDVFDESRYFNPGQETCTIDVPSAGQAVRVGITICEDLWNDHQFAGRLVYGQDPLKRHVTAGANLLINLSASPYRMGVQADRESLFARQIREHRVPLVYVNQVGGNDDLIFDGSSVFIDATGQVAARAKSFVEDLLILDTDQLSSARLETYPDRVAGVRQALVLGVRDYLGKCGFSSVVIGISGGIDSAVTAALAAEALGADHVHGVAMPSRHSSHHSVEDARQLAKNLGIRFSLIEIESVHRAMEQAVAPIFNQHQGTESGVAEENIQARLRGNILMALSNKTNALLLTTGNKSELAVGYCTLYGDMCGGLAVLSDVPKTTVYEMARLINKAADQPLIPLRTIDKPPSAELRPNQLDQDTLPPYDLLDAILERYVEQELDVETISSQGFDREMVMSIARRVDRNEYKRQQAPIGIKVTSRAFGPGRRMPIAAHHG